MSRIIVLLLFGVAVLAMFAEPERLVEEQPPVVQIEQWIVTVEVDDASVRCSPTFDSRDDADAYLADLQRQQPSLQARVRPQTTVVPSE